MAYKNMYAGMGTQAIADTKTSAKHVLGTMARAYDDVYGEGEFIYLVGVASTAIGDLVVYDQKNGTTTRTVAASKGPCAVAMSANVAGQYGWYCVRGAVPVKASAAAAGAIPYVDATAGDTTNVVVANQGITGAVQLAAPVGGLADTQLLYPSIGGL